MGNKPIYIAFLAALILLAVGCMLIMNSIINHGNNNRLSQPEKNYKLDKSIENFADCIAAGNQANEGFPATCRTKDGKVFTDNKDAAKETRQEEINCKDFNADNCPEACVVCPPCAACSSISCQSEEYCASLGFSRSWYEDIKKAMPKDADTEKESCKNLCGDGVCQEIVCLELGCPCAETAAICPADCQSDSN